MDTNDTNLGKKTTGITKTASKLSAACLCLLQICTLIAITITFGGQVAFAALTPPDLLEIKGAWVYRHLIETDDFLVVLHYNIEWTDPLNIPDDPANKTFLVRLMSTDDNEELGVTTPYPFYSSGYYQGIAAIYLPAAEAPTWGQGYVLHLEGNPSKWATPPTIKYTLTSSDYCSFDTTQENHTQLGVQIIESAQDLEVAWDVPGELVYATDVGTVLTLTGETYYLGAVPGLRVMAPSVFALQTLDVDWDYQTHDPTQAEEYEHQYDDTPIGEAIDALGELFGGVSPRLITGIFLIIVMLGVMVISSVKYQTSTPGLLAGATVLVLSVPLGIFSMALLAVITFLVILFIGFTFYFKNASG